MELENHSKKPPCVHPEEQTDCHKRYEAEGGTLTCLLLALHQCRVVNNYEDNIASGMSELAANLQFTQDSHFACPISSTVVDLPTEDEILLNEHFHILLARYKIQREKKRS